MAELIVFDIYSDFAHFKRPYTTTSPVTFPIPSKPTVYGMIGAIIGLDKESYLEQFHGRGVQVGIKINKPIHKVYIAENLINTKDGMARIKSRTQIKIEFLKHAAYRIYISHPDGELRRTLLQNLEAHHSHYTFSMGLSECIGNFKFVGHFSSETKNHQKTNDWVEIHSVIPANALAPEEDPILFEPGKEVFRVSLTAEMNPDREIQQVTDIIFERNGKPVKSKVRSYEEITGLKENILLF
jgi:CRISPR-associated protein Cas5h